MIFYHDNQLILKLPRIYIHDKHSRFNMILLAALLVSSRVKPQPTALWEAVLRGNYKEAMMLVRAGADMNALRPDDKNDETLLHLLAKRANYKKCTKFALFLLDHGANANAIDDIGNSVLHYAVRSSSIELVEKLLKCGAKVDVNNKYDVDVLFDAAMNSRRCELLLLLLKYDIPNLETRDRRGVTALKYLIHRFFTKDDEHTIRALLDLGLPVNETEGLAGWTSLHYATVMDNFTLVNLLLEYGADVNKKTEVGVMPLGYAASQKRSSITKILVEKGANIHECSESDGQYPIHYSCLCKSVDNIRFLLQRGADINVIGENGATPFSSIKGGFTKSHQVVIKHFAVMSVKGIAVNDSDLDIIYERPEAQGFYQQCLNELQRMKESKVIGCISFFSIVERTFKELAFLARNEKFVTSFGESDAENCFPLYFVEMDVALGNAIECRNKLKPSEKALRESLSDIIPELVLDKITFYMYLNELH